MIDVDDEVARCQPLEEVARDDAAHGLRPADADAAEELPIGDEGEAVRTAGEAAVEAALDEGDRAGWRCLRSVDDRRGMAGLLEQLGEARGLVGGEDNPGVVFLPAFHRLRDGARPSGRELRLAPTEQVA